MFAGTLIVFVPPPLQLTEGNESAAAPAGSETALRVQTGATAPVVLSAISTLPPLLVGSVVDCGVKASIVVPGPA